MHVRIRHILGLAAAVMLIVAGLAIVTTRDPRTGVRVFQWESGPVVTPEAPDGRFDQRLDGSGILSTVTLDAPGIR
jgi:hypothetical protein